MKPLGATLLIALLGTTIAAKPADGATWAAVTGTTVSGGGLRPNAEVRLEENRRTITKTRTDRHGRFAVPRRGRRITVRAGAQRIALSYRPGTGEVASPNGARIRFSPLVAQPGAAVRISAAGLARNAEVRVSLGASEATGRTNRRGTFATTLTMPNSGATGTFRATGVSLPFTVQAARPIRAAFYYPWFPESWRQRGIYPFTHFHPLAGLYSEDDPATLRRQVDDMLYGRIDAGIVSWFGQGSRSDRRMPALLRAARGRSFRWAIYHEGEGHGDPSVGEIRSDLHYIRDRYASDPSYLRMNGRFVVFVYADASDGAGMAQRWHEANDVNAYVVLKVFSGYRSVQDQPDSWHQYAPARADDEQAGFSYSVSPGFWHAQEQPPRLARDVARFKQSVRAMVASNAPWQLVTTFNEWGEGTAVEGAQEWPSPSGRGAYLDALHADGR